MAEGGEIRGFVFAITFILVFAALLGSIPTDLQGQGGTAEALLPVDTDLLIDFSETENFTKSAFGGNYFYNYDLGGYKWHCGFGGTSFVVRQKILVAGFWLGGLKYIEFVLDNGTNRGQALTFSEIEGDAESGTVRYDLKYTDSGNDAGGFVFYWNTTTYSDPETAWNADALHLLHGVGIDSTAAGNVFTLLLDLLFLQLPEVPVLVNALLATPIWACIVYLIWFAIKETMPFV